MVAIRLHEAEGRVSHLGDSLYAPEFLIERPLMQALTQDDKGPPVLLIDEIDRADEPFEAFLLELLSDFQITVPELGTIRADTPPIVIITSNRTREVHDALRRRCLYHWVDYPSLESEKRILALKAPQLGEQLRDQLVSFIHRLRDLELFKKPGVAESIDWAHALTQLDAVTLTADLVNDTLGSLLKYQDDIARVQGSEAARLLAEIQAAA
jgi:MoxR-like ATPase